jgi:hypothetical protein
MVIGAVRFSVYLSQRHLGQFESVNVRSLGLIFVRFAMYRTLMLFTDGSDVQTL